MKIKDEDYVEPFTAGLTAPIRLEFLEPGRRFEICGLEKLFKNLSIIRISPSSVLIRGEKLRDEEDKWLPLGSGYYVSCSTMVRGL